ncbi:DUF397 domain-containing protein [Streptomyces sp. B93]|uniref:DUF397 domain-containing protein n=1 Tax=Streptomyces sp. B93 TaxID=2824875 RepID=UPI001B37D5E0|nr:DUF397 domain-containing protein [Streptomyces sp. B93]MBQ1090624.1 DUF397 domain-containing protein [Streptomyces sp. B93]
MTNAEIWRKASYSGGGEGNACVEIAHLGPHIAVRDSKQPTRARVTLRASAFTAFVESLKARP